MTSKTSGGHSWPEGEGVSLISGPDSLLMVLRAIGAMWLLSRSPHPAPPVGLRASGGQEAGVLSELAWSQGRRHFHLPWHLVTQAMGSKAIAGAVSPSLVISLQTPGLDKQRLGWSVSRIQEAES